MTHQDESRTPEDREELSDDRQQAVDEWGRRAGAALRNPAPDKGASDIMRRARSQRIARVGGSALAVVVVAIVAVAVVVNLRDQQTNIDDTEIAGSAIISTEDLGAGWAISHQFDGLTSRGVAETAAKVPECAPYVDYAFDSPNRPAVTAGRIFSGPPDFSLTQWVYIFPTKAAATAAMDKIAEPSFGPCLDKFMDKFFTELSGGNSSNTKSVDAPPITTHGDRQVIVAQTLQFPGLRVNLINAFIQVGRGIVYVDPTTVASDGAGAAAEVEPIMTAATDALATALDSGNT
jgi:hypothetical protein